MKMQQKNLKEGNLYFPKWTNSISQTSVGTTGKLERTGKITYLIMLYLSGLVNTLTSDKYR